MTTTVSVEAHCSMNKEVLISIMDTQAGSQVEQFTLQDGEKAERYAYDGRIISVSERLKATDVAP